jgi:cephalosporin-C deacetylase-like acetyl esterase
MRGIDYLQSRSDVDGSRIGCTGCSGGGTLTTYISALDDRIKAAAPACYVTSWRELLIALGPQDGEQSFPGFVSEGLDIADYIELFAPKPWLMVNTIQDFFPLEGARQTYEEARRWYRLYGAEERMGWHIGPGGHGWPQPSREAIYGWFIRWLKDGKGDAGEPAFKLTEPDALLVTSTGQVADSLGGETVFTLNRKRALDLLPRTAPDAKSLAAAVRELAGIETRPGGAPPRLTVHRTVMRAGYRVEVASFETVPGVHVPAMLAIPDGAGTHGAVLLADPRPRATIAAPGGDFEALAQAGRVVMAVAPRGISEADVSGRGSILGDYNTAMRAAVVGKTLPGMRAEDLMRAVDALLARPDVKKEGVTAVAQGSLGVPLLYAALLDKRIGEVVVQETLASYRTVVERPVHRGVYEVAVPGALRRYDLEHIVAALAPAAVTLVNPVDAAGNPARLEPIRKQLGGAGRVRVENRGRRDPLAGYLRTGL